MSGGVNAEVLELGANGVAFVAAEGRFAVKCPGCAEALDGLRGGVPETGREKRLGCRLRRLTRNVTGVKKPRDVLDVACATCGARVERIDRALVATELWDAVPAPSGKGGWRVAADKAVETLLPCGHWVALHPQWLGRDGRFVGRVGCTTCRKVVDGAVLEGWTPPATGGPR